MVRLISGPAFYPFAEQRCLQNTREIITSRASFILLMCAFFILKISLSSVSSIVHKKDKTENQKAKEFARFFNPWCTSFHTLSDVFGIMLIHPVKHSIFVKEKAGTINQVNYNSCQVGSRKKYSLVCFETKKGSIQVDRDPEIGIGIVVLEGRGDYKEDGEEDVEDFH